MIKQKIILCIPGNWDNRSEIVTAIAENNLNDFIFAGTILLNIKTNKAFEVEICERDDEMKNAFECAGMVNQLSNDFLSKIDQHKYVIYLSTEGGSLENAHDIAAAGNAILNAGGIGIKVETAGKAFTKEQWNDLLSNYDEPALYRMFVIDSIIDENNNTFTCGMHNFGLKDCIAYREKLQDSVQLLSIFNYYQLFEKPEIHSGQTFSIDMEAPVFEITEEYNQPYKNEKLFENPYGMWKLERKAN